MWFQDFDTSEKLQAIWEGIIYAQELKLDIQRPKCSVEELDLQEGGRPFGIRPSYSYNWHWFFF